MQSLFNFAIRFFTLCIGWAMLLAMAAGQTNIAPAAAPASTPIPPKQLKLRDINLSGSLRVRVENWDWWETPGFDDNYTFGAAVLRLSLGQQKEKVDWLVEGEFPLLINVPERAVAPGQQGQLGHGGSYFAANSHQDGSAILKQAFVRVKNIFGDEHSSLRFGRMEFAEGAEGTATDPTIATLKRDSISQRLVGNFGFTHVGRSFDAIHYSRSTKEGTFTFFGGRPTEGVFQLRGLKQLDVDVWYSSYTKPIANKKVTSELRVLGLHYHDGRGALKADNRAVALRRIDHDNIRISTVGGNYVAALKTTKGTVDLLAWGVGQFGSWGNQTHRAGAIVFEGGIQPSGTLNKYKTWLRGGYSHSTGDRNATDNRHTTFFQVLPTPRQYARLPFYNMMNVDDVYGQLKIKPHSRVALRGDVHRLRLTEANDLWYIGGGAFQETTFGYAGRSSGCRKGLGTVFDISADITINPTTTLTLYGAGVRGGAIQSIIYPAGGKNPTSRYFYAELTKRF